MIRRTFMSMLAAVLPITQEKTEEKPIVSQPQQAGQFSNCGVIVKAIPCLFCSGCGNQLHDVPRSYTKEEAYVIAICHTKHCKYQNKKVLVPFSRITGISVEECQ